MPARVRIPRVSTFFIKNYVFYSINLTLSAPKPFPPDALTSPLGLMTFSLNFRNPNPHRKFFMISIPETRTQRTSKTPAHLPVASRNYYTKTPKTHQCSPGFQCQPKIPKSQIQSQNSISRSNH